MAQRAFPAHGISRPNPLVVVVMVALWLAVGCALPLHRVQVARRLGRAQLLGFLSVEKPDKTGILTAFENSNRDLDAAASGPCLILAVSVIYLSWQLLKLKRRYNEADLHSRTTNAATDPIPPE